MRESIFRRVDRVTYRREIARDPLPGAIDRIGWQWAYLFLIPSLLYGISLPLLRAGNEEWFRIIIGWTDPWWEDWTKKHIPAISKVSEDLVAHGAANQIVLAQHAYSVGILFGLISVIVCGYLLWRMPKHGRLKRRFIYTFHRYPGGIKLKTLSAIYVFGILFFSYEAWDMYSRGYEGDTGSGNITRSLDFHITDFASLPILFLYTATPMMLFTIYIGAYFHIKVCYVHIRQGIRIRKDRARGVV